MVSVSEPRDERFQKGQSLTRSCIRFLLKYVSRDEVELLDQGVGGVSEARAAVAQYEDLSPLYGLIMYRRKKVLIKYVPEGTSRLLQGQSSAGGSAVGRILTMLISSDYGTFTGCLGEIFAIRNHCRGRIRRCPERYNTRSSLPITYSSTLNKRHGA